MVSGGNDNDIDIELIVKDNDADRKIDQIDHNLSDLDKTAKKTTGALEGLSRGFDGIKAAKGAAIAVAAFVASAGAATAAIVALAAKGEELGSLRAGFDALGGTSDILNEARDRTLGLTKATDLLAIANKGLSAQIPGYKQGFADIADLGARLGNSLNKDVTQTITQLNDAIISGRTAGLSQLGILVDSKKAYEDYGKAIGVAAKDLDDIQKRQALQAASLKAVKDSLQIQAQVTDSTKNSYDALLNSISDLTGEIGVVINESPELTAVFRDLQAAIIENTPAIVAFVKEGLQVATQRINEFIIGARFLNDALGPVFSVIKDVGIAVFQALGKVIFEVISKVRSMIDVVRSAKDTVIGFAVQLGVLDEASAQVVETVEAQVKSTHQLAREQLSAEREKRKLIKAEQDLRKVGIEVAASTIKNTEATKEQEDAAKALKDQIKKTNEELENFKKSLDLSLTLTRSVDKVEDFKHTLGTVFSDSQVLDQSQEFINYIKETGDELIRMGVSADTVLSGVADRVKEAKDSVRQGGGIFDGIFESLFGGGDGSDIQQGLQENIGKSIGDALASGISDFAGAIDGGKSQDFKNAAQSLGKSAGAALGSEFGPVGSYLGSFLGGKIAGGISDGISHAFGGKLNAEANAREDFEGFLIDAFDAVNASAVINGELKKLSDLVDFPRDIFSNAKDGVVEGFAIFDDLPDVARNAFSGVGLALSEIIGDPENLGFQFAGELATAFQGNLFALRGAVDSLGISFEDMGKAIETSTKKGEQSFLEAEGALRGLGTLAENGIPGQIGAVTTALDAVKQAGVFGGATTIAAFKAIGAEAKELGGKSITDLKDIIEATGGSTKDAAQIFEALSEAGVESIQDIIDISDRGAIQVLADLQSQGFAFSDLLAQGGESLASDIDRIKEKLDALNRADVQTNLTINVKTKYLDSGAQSALNQVGPGIAQ